MESAHDRLETIVRRGRVHLKSRDGKLVRRTWWVLRWSKRNAAAYPSSSKNLSARTSRSPYGWAKVTGASPRMRVSLTWESRISRSTTASERRDRDGCDHVWFPISIPPDSIAAKSALVSCGVLAGWLEAVRRSSSIASRRSSSGRRLNALNSSFAPSEGIVRTDPLRP